MIESEIVDANGPLDPRTLLQPKRKINGISAILLPFLHNWEIDWASFADHIRRTVEAGLIPAVNMDTGFANLIDANTRNQVLETTRQTIDAASDQGEFVAGAFVGDSINDQFNFAEYANQTDAIQEWGGTPIIFQSFGLAHVSDDQVIDNYQRIATCCDRFLAFELGQMFAPFGKIYSLEVYRQLLSINACAGAKHSSLRRELEWQRLQMRNRHRPEFLVLTGNDLAIDMVMYGSDYLLGLSTFCPDMFAIRDRFWASGDPKFYELNDVLQYLGFFAFREPTAAYKHSAAMFLNQRGWIKTDLTHPKSISRPQTDRAILFQIGRQLDIEIEL